MKKKHVIVVLLAAAYAAAGRFEEAVTTAKRALAAAQTRGLQGLAAKIEMRLALYREGKAYRDSGQAKSK